MVAVVSRSTSITGVVRFSVKVLTTVPGKVGTYCDISDGEAGCCRIGKICVSECRDFYNVNCKTYCCLKGTTCGPNETCKRETDGDPRCDAGYSLCAEFYGCCPNGVRCILPRYCAIPCATDHPKCGNGCCEKGYYCTEDQMCARLNRYTSLVGLTTTRQIYTDYPTKTLVYTVTIFDSTPTETKPSSKSIYVPPISSSSSSGDTTKLQTHTYTPWQLPAPTAVSGAAPAMCAMLDGLGMAAGILGVFAM